jgi:hypothetical protein
MALVFPDRSGTGFIGKAHPVHVAGYRAANLDRDVIGNRVVVQDDPDEPNALAKVYEGDVSPIIAV